MDEKRAIEIISERLEDSLVVSTTGMISRYLYAVKDRPENFYMLGSMGLASSIGLGLALNCDRQVIVLDGDGSCLMNMGSMATIGHYAPANLAHIVIDNGQYNSTGGQPTVSDTAQLLGIARSCGYGVVEMADSESKLRLQFPLANALTFILVKVKPSENVNRIPLEPERITERFMSCIN